MSSSSRLSGASAKKKVVVDEEALTPAGLTEDMVLVLGKRDSKAFRNVLAALERDEGLEPLGVVFGPAKKKKGSVAVKVGRSR